MTISVVLMMPFYWCMKQFSIKMLKKKEKTHWKYVRTWKSILVLWLRSQTREPLGHEARSCAALNNRTNSRDSATIVFVTRAIVYVVWFRLSNIYLSLVLRWSVLIRCQWIFLTHFNYFILSRKCRNTDMT